MSEPARSKGVTKKKTRTRKKAQSKSGTLKSQSLGPPKKSGQKKYWGPLGAVGLFLGTPFLATSLTYPEWTGSLGQALGSSMFVALGQAALILPGFAMLGSLAAVGFRAARRLHWHWAPPLMGSLIMMAARVEQQGGVVGGWLDSMAVAAVGPAGAWLGCLTGCALCSLAFVGITVQDGVEAVHGLSSRFKEFVKSRRDAWHEARLAAAEPSLELEPQPEWTPPTAPEPPIWQEMEAVESMEIAAAEALAGAEEQAPSRKSSKSRKQETKSSQEGVSDSVEVTPVAEQAPEGEPMSELQPSDSLEQQPSSLEIASVEHSEESWEKPVSVEVASAEVVESPPSEPAPEGSLEPVVPLVPKKIVEEGVMEDPNGQLRLFPGPPPEPTVTYKLPPLTLLDEAPVALRKRPVEDKSQVLLDSLDSFGVKASLLQIVRGPTVTRYELQPARGVKVSRFTSLTNDIALALASTAVRIEAPIPGKSAIGIEIPNDNNDLVVLKEIVASKRFRNSKGLTVALGKNLSGQPEVTNLQKMPHLLVAGTTGSGKSVCVNGLIISLLYRFSPRQLQLMMVDPKQVELSIYEGIPHLVAFAGQSQGEIIVDPKTAALALHQVVELMEQRYTCFAEARVRNLDEYNQKAVDPLPWFVVIIDELADLMMVASKSVETSICRIAQKARAAGIHLVLATQRPSADVITGLIKVNIPSRAAFAVSSQVDSRVILDSSGAEHLLGKGDMLFLPVDASDPRRIQGSYVSNEEITRVVEFWKAQGTPENLIELDVQETQVQESDDDEEDADDALLQEGLKVILQRKAASASMLQTQLKVGYARARRLLIAMEKRGWVGPPDGSKPRKILYSGPVPE